jgi:predicted DNA binding CopG/RHH family protein
MKTVQRFTDEHLEHGRTLTADQVLRFLDDFRCLHAHRTPVSKLISLKVPSDLLNAFKTRAKISGTPYQTQIKRLMKAWVLDSVDSGR